MIKFLIKCWWRHIDALHNKEEKRKTPINGVFEITDIRYRNDDDLYHRLDVYRPEGDGKKLPVVIDIHGGGWAYGTKDLNKYYCFDIAKRGFAVVNISYHLMFDKAYPDPVQDIFSAFGFVSENAEKYNMDINNVFVTGDSAGAHYAALACVINNDENLRRLFGVRKSLDIKAVGLVCGVYDFTPMLSLAGGFGKKYIGFLFDNKKRFYESEMFKACDIKARADLLPPAFINTSFADFLRKENIELAEILKGLQKDVLFVDYKKEDAAHKLEHVYNVSYPEWEESKYVNDSMCNFFKNNLT